MMTRAELLAAADKTGLAKRFHSWAQLPKDHAFGTWHIPQTDFSGSDDQVEMRSYQLIITFWYQDMITDADIEKEEEFEGNVRAAGRYSKLSDYDTESRLYYSRYTFDITEFYE